LGRGSVDRQGQPVGDRDVGRAQHRLRAAGRAAHGYKPEQVAEALAAKIQTLPDSLRRSLTWDQGPEMRDWKQIRVDAGIEVYFCDPHSPWQRGTNENTNGLLRQYFPKGTDLSTLTDADLDRVADELNDRPRKRLGFYKPSERIADLCGLRGGSSW
jgi:transposase, IS30 family